MAFGLTTGIVGESKEIGDGITFAKRQDGRACHIFTQPDKKVVGGVEFSAAHRNIIIIGRDSATALIAELQAFLDSEPATEGEADAAVE